MFFAIDLFNNSSISLKLFLLFTVTFCFSPEFRFARRGKQKSTPEIASLIGTFHKQGAPKQITSVFRDGALIKL